MPLCLSFYPRLITRNSKLCYMLGSIYQNLRLGITFSEVKETWATKTTTCEGDSAAVRNVLNAIKM